MAASRRIQNEISDIEKTGSEHFSVSFPSSQDVFSWAVQMFGPPGSPYEGKTFAINIKFPEEYPFRCPDFKFVTKIQHPHVNDSTGKILKIEEQLQKWAPNLTVKSLLDGIYEQRK